MRHTSESIGKNIKRKPHQALTIDYFFDRSIPEPNSGCWIWLGAMSGTTGYGSIRVDRKTFGAHRVIYQIAIGKTAPRGIDVCHRCDVPLCVNPDHLFLGTRSDNLRDCVRKGRNFVPILKGSLGYSAKLSVADVAAIRADGALSQRSLAHRYGVTHATIGHIKRGVTWREI